MSDRNGMILDMTLAGVPMRRIARELGCSVGTVSGVLSRARRRGDYSPGDVVREGEVVVTMMDRLAGYHVGIDGCRWVVGDPGVPGWRWCGRKPLVTESPPYCAEHQARIYDCVSR